MEFWKNIFDTVETELYEPIPATLTGKIPPWVRGTFLRVGPGKFDLGANFCMNHYFDGFAMLYAFNINGNKVTFSKRYLQSDAYRKAIKNGKPVYGEFGTRSHSDHSKSMLSRVFASFDPTLITDNGGLNVFKLGREVFATSETFYIRRIDGRTLETKEKVDLSKYMPVNALTGHPLTDHDGISYNIGISFLPTPRYVVLKVSPTAEQEGKDVWINTESIGSVPSQWKSSYGYIHSFSLTDNYIVFMEMPLVIHVFRLATANVKGRCLKDCWDWYEQELVKFWVVNKRTGEAVKTKYFSDKAFMCLHHINAFEVGNQIVLDLVIFPDDEAFSSFYISKGRNNIKIPADPRPTRFVIPLIDNINEANVGENLVQVGNTSATAHLVSDYQRGDYIELSGETICEFSFDMHCINTKYRGKPYRYSYGCAGMIAPDHSDNSIIKLDASTGESILWRAEPSQFPSEPVFIQNPNSTQEDDGVLLTAVRESNPENPNYLVVLDARTLSEIARAVIEESFPCGLHGTYIPEKRIDEIIPYGNHVR